MEGLPLCVSQNTQLLKRQDKKSRWFWKSWCSAVASSLLFQPKVWHSFPKRKIISLPGRWDPLSFPPTDTDKAKRGGVEGDPASGISRPTTPDKALGSGPLWRLWCKCLGGPRAAPFGPAWAWQGACPRPTGRGRERPAAFTAGGPHRPHRAASLWQGLGAVCSSRWSADRAPGDLHVETQQRVSGLAGALQCSPGL